MNDNFYEMSAKMKELFPSSPKADREALMSMANGGQPQQSAQSTTNYIHESIDVPQGSLPMDRDYSINDFAALAGIKLTEAPIAPAVAPDANKVGMGAKQIGNKIGAKGGAGMMSKALDKVAQGGALPANLSKQIAPFAKQLEVILGDPGLRNKFLMIVKAAEGVSKKNVDAQAPGAQAQPQESKKSKNQPIKSRDPNWRDMEALRKSGAAGSHGDKTKVIPRKEKYKTDFSNQESIKEMLYRKLAEKNS